MEPSANYATVGGVVLGFLAAIVFAALWLGRASHSNQEQRYIVYFKDHSLAGLQRDADVTMRGMKIGKVETFQILPSDIEKVRVLLRLDNTAPIKADTRAVVNRNLLTGLANIDLIGSTQQSPPRTEPAEGEEFPVIPEGQGKFEQITASLPVVLNQANVALHQIATIFSDQNTERFRSILENIDEFSTSLSQHDDQLLESALRLTQEAATLAAVLPKQSGEITKAVVDGTHRLEEKSDRLFIELSNALRELQISLKAVSSTMEGLRDPKGVLFGEAGRERGPGEDNEGRNAR